MIRETTLACSLCIFSAFRITVAVKKEGWSSRIPGSLGGGLTRTLSFQLGNSGDLSILKPISKQQLGISIGVGLPKDSSRFIYIFIYYSYSKLFIQEKTLQRNKMKFN